MPSFLQTPEWAEIQRRDGHDGAEISLGGERIFYFRHRTPLGFFYFYAPRAKVSDPAAFAGALERLKRETGALFFRLEPESEIVSIKFPVRQAPDVQPEKNARVALSDDEAMLARMHPKTRYNIRLSEKHGMTVETRVGSDAFEIFFQLLRKTATRDGFRLHPKAHYENLLRSNSHRFTNELFFALYQGKPAAALMANFYQDTATYLHGGSDERFKKYMAPYLLHWAVAKEARRRGFLWYDLGGIDEVRWPGLTRFKLGFGALAKTYPPARDIIFRSGGERLYRVFRALSRLIRFSR